MKNVLFAKNGFNFNFKIMINKPIKILIYLTLLSAILIIIDSCTCSCTEIGCISDTRPFVIMFSKDDFSENELESISIIRADKSLNKIDTIRIDHYLNKNDYSIDFFNIGNFNQDDFEIKAYSYLILNNSINQVDSITEINYDVEIISEVCNTCSGGINCEDEYYEYKKYINPQFRLNDNEINGFEILIEMK